MNTTGAALSWLKANPDMIVLIGVVFLVGATLVDAKQNKKSIWYVVGSVATLTVVGVLTGVFFTYFRK